MTWRTNVKAWWAGWGQEPDDGFKPGYSWKSPLWLAIYGLDYGTRVLTGGACVSWSRWWYDRRRQLGSAGFATRLLNHLQANHGRNSGGPLWGTADTGWAIRGATIFWGGLLVLLAWIAWRVLT